MKVAGDYGRLAVSKWCWALGCLGLVCSAPAARAEEVLVGTSLCGPRAVEFVLHWYQRDEDLPDLISEMQGGDPRKPVSMAVVAAALEKRGLHTLAVKNYAEGTPDWPHPVIVHAQDLNGFGHFVTRVPRRGDRPVLYWSGDRGFTHSLDETGRRPSGYALLVAPTEIDAAAINSVRHETGLSPMSWGICGVTGSGLIYIAIRYLRRREQQAGPCQGV